MYLSDFARLWLGMISVQAIDEIAKELVKTFTTVAGHRATD